MDYIKLLKDNNLLRVIDSAVDIDLEIAHISYIEVKKNDSKALLFTNVIDKNGKNYPPVLTNIYGSKKATKLIFGNCVDELANEIQTLLTPKKPQGFGEKINFLSHLFQMRKVLTKRLRGKGECQEIVKFADDINLYDLPVLKTWEHDGGPFITMGQAYTKSLDGQMENLGMYRLQVFDKKRLGIHWQIHKDGAHFFNEYKKAGKKMPVSVAIGGDPLYIWCGQAPMPKGFFELLLYGFIRKSPAKLVKSQTNDIYIPHDVDYVIEGFVDTSKFELEGPFGDHTGFYTPIEPFPVIEVSAITHKKNPIFHATVVGKPPLEDKYMGWATERIFLPLLKTTVPDLIDYNMPENGVFHNLILAKIDSCYPAHAKQAMHAFWGVGQMSFVKHAIFVPSNAPMLDEYEQISNFILDRFGSKSLLVTEGVCDQLDHASPNSCYGGKLGVDVTADYSNSKVKILSDNELFEKFKKVSSSILELKQYKVNTKSPICVIKFKKQELVKDVFNKLLIFRENFKILVFVSEKNRLNNPYMLIWRVVNNIDAIRDLYIDSENFCLDATEKDEKEGYERGWPKQTDCSKKVIKSLVERGLIDNDLEFFEKFEILD